MSDHGQNVRLLYNKHYDVAFHYKKTQKHKKDVKTLVFYPLIRSVDLHGFASASAF